MADYIDLNTVLSEFDDKGTLLKWLKKLEGESSGLNGRLTTVEETITDHTGILSQYGLAIGSHTGLISALTTVQTQLKNRIDTMEPKLEDVDDDIDSLQTLVSMHSSELEGVELELQSLGARMESAEDSLSLLSQAYAKLSPFYVRVVVSGTTAQFVDYNYNALCTAIANGSNIVLYDGVSDAHKGNLYYMYYNDNNASFVFSSIFYDTTLKNRVLQINSNNITVITRNFSN